jgi:hypothetical protein
MPPKQRRTDLLCVVSYNLYKRLKDLHFDIADETFQQRMRESSEHPRAMFGIHGFMRIIQYDLHSLEIKYQEVVRRAMYAYPHPHMINLKDQAIAEWLREVELSPFMLAYKYLRECTITDPPGGASRQEYELIRDETDGHQETPGNSDETA